MAALNLVPDPALMAVHGGIFLASLYVVKHLMIAPYLQLRDRRNQQTVGGQKEAEKSRAAAASHAQTIEARLQEAFDYEKGLRAATKAKAQSEQDELIKAAKLEAKHSLEQLRGEIVAALNAEKAKIPTVTRQLREQVYASLSH